MSSSKNILLTGGAGYIGSHVALSLLDKGYAVTIIDNLITGNEKIIPKKAEFIKCDISDEKIISNLLSKKNFDALMHFAALVKVEESLDKPNDYLENNYKKSSVLFRTCIKNGLNNFIFSSTASVYGNKSKLPVNESSHLSPLNPYAESKILTEKYLIKLNKEKMANYIILRYFNVAGADPLLRSGLISKNPTHLIKIASEAAVKKRDQVVIFGDNYPTPDGSAIRDYIHVSDLAELHILSLDYLIKNNDSTIMNCGYGYGYSVKTILNEINSIIKEPLNIKIGNKRKGDAISLVANIDKLKKKLQWNPKYNDLKKILDTSIKWEEKIINEKIL